MITMKITITKKPLSATGTKYPEGLRRGRVGAIGRQVVLQLTAMGIPWLHRVNFGIVEVSNIASQGSLHDDLGRPNVEATADLCHQVNHGLDVHTTPQRSRRSMAVGNCIFSCVDSIDVRRSIWDSVKGRTGFFVDERMTRWGANSLRLLVCRTVDRPFRNSRRASCARRAWP